MKKKFIIAGVAGVLALSGSGVAYQAYAAQNETLPSTNTLSSVEAPVLVKEQTPANNVIVPETDIEVPVDPTIEQKNVDLKDTPVGEVILPEKLSDPSSIKSLARQTAAADQGLIRQNIGAMELGTGIKYQATYVAADGTEYFAVQNKLETDPATAIQDIKGFYNEPVQDTEINGEAAVYVDGQARKVVHFFVGDRSMYVSSYSINSSIEDTLAVAEQIAEQGSK